MTNKLRVLKIGGNIIDDATKLNQALQAFADWSGPKILIHGGGKIATTFSQKLGIESKLVDGRRITSDQDLEVVTMVYAGLINKNMVAQLQALGCNAAGFSGADANVILSEKRPAKPTNFGWVGDVKKVNADVINAWLKSGVNPVFCGITHDGKGQLLNTNADTIAAEIAIALSGFYQTELIYCFEKKGVLANIDDENSVIPEIDSTQYEMLKNEHIIHDGMLPKMENCFYALQKNVAKVSIGNLDFIKNENAVHSALKL